MVRSLWICLTIISAASATGLVWPPALNERHLDSSIAQRGSEYGDHSGSSVFADPRLFRRAHWRPGGGGGGGGGGTESTTPGGETQPPPPPDSPPNPDPPPASDAPPPSSSQMPPAPAPQSNPSSDSTTSIATLPGAAVASVETVAPPSSTTRSASTTTSPTSQPITQPQNQVTATNTPSSMLAVYIIVGIAGFLILIAVALHFLRGKRVAASRSQSRTSYPFVGRGRSAGSGEEGFTMVQTRSADVATTTEGAHYPPPQPLVHDVPHYDSLGASHMYPSTVSTIEPQSRWSRDF